MRILRILLASCWPLWGTAYTCSPGQTITLSADVTISGSDTIDYVGSSGSHCTVIGAGHKITGSTSAHATFQYVDFSGLGIFGAATENSATAAAMSLTGSNFAAFTLQNSTFTASNGVIFTLANTNTATVDYNTWASSIIQEAETCSGTCGNVITLKGTTVGATVQITHNKTDIGEVYSAVPNTLVDSNLMTGYRASLVLDTNAANSVVTNNYMHCNLNNSVDGYQLFSQVPGLEMLCASCTAHDNVVRRYHWVVNSIGTAYNNLITEAHPHAYLQTPVGGTATWHHNIIAHPDLGRDSYNVAGISGERGMAVNYNNSAVTSYNNSFDLRSIGVGLQVDVDGAVNPPMVSMRSNAFYYSNLTGNCAIIGPSFCVAGTGQQRISYSDYNLFSYNPSTSFSNTYSINVASATECGANWGAHDKNCPNAGVDPQFLGPLPQGFPFQEADILAGTITVSDILNYYRFVYSPASTGSPLYHAADPADGTHDIGAVDFDTVVPVTVVNKRPVVDAGTSFTTSGTSATTYLAGIVTDDAVPPCNGTMSTTWSKVSGTGTPTWTQGSSAAPISAVTFNATGTYVMRLTALETDNGSMTCSSPLTTTADVTIIVGSPTPPATGASTLNGKTTVKGAAVIR